MSVAPTHPQEVDFSFNWAQGCRLPADPGRRGGGSCGPLPSHNFAPPQRPSTDSPVLRHRRSSCSPANSAQHTDNMHSSSHCCDSHPYAYECERIAQRLCDPHRVFSGNYHELPLSDKGFFIITFVCQHHGEMSSMLSLLDRFFWRFSGPALSLGLAGGDTVLNRSETTMCTKSASPAGCFSRWFRKSDAASEKTRLKNSRGAFSR